MPSSYTKWIIKKLRQFFFKKSLFELDTLMHFSPSDSEVYFCPLLSFVAFIEHFWHHTIL